MHWTLTNSNIAYFFEFGLHNADIKVLIYIQLYTESKADVPDTWSPMNEKEYMKVVTLQTTDNEYKDVLQQFNNSSGGNFSVTKVSLVLSWL